MMLEQVFGLNQESDNVSIVSLSINSLVPFSNQPFKLYSDDKLAELANDIEKNGLINPIVVRPINRGKYEILAGHNRVNAFKKIGKTEIPSIIKELNDNEAKLVLVQSNLLQRQELSNAEKALAYKMRNEALKSQGQKGTGNTLEILAEDSNDSKRTIARYIKATKLVTELFDAFDDNEFSLPVAEQLASLSINTQNKIVEEILFTDTKLKAPLINEIKELEQVNPDITNEMIQNLLSQNEKEKKKISFEELTTIFKMNEVELRQMLEKLAELKLLKKTSILNL